ncbi:sulfotransferase [Maribius pontilimi]|uniref:Sulfotransferase n=1 Tax=Palleronia pontilimi TaxID=1964209 RepID=A0A934MB48_9RHOB|nr:sulfotransferase [Palleronia pontilimi]MBJ3764357.1 sulfotransferase [Palleronia pontilimi]
MISMTDFPHLHAPDGGYVFVVTYGRSGSTLIQSLLNTLPGYCIRGENAGTLRHLHAAHAVLMSNDAFSGFNRQGHETAPTVPWYGAERVDTARYATALADTFVREVLTLPPGTRVAGFKEIRHHRDAGNVVDYLHFLTDTFPKARIVFNTRDHGAVARSGWWRTMPSGDVARILAEMESDFAAFAARAPARCVTLRYDDYCADPDALRALFDLLDEPFDADLVARVLERKLVHKGV